jgi:hypothetical protein
MTDPRGVVADDEDVPSRHGTARRAFKVLWRKLFEEYINLESWPPENIETWRSWDWEGK